MLKNVRAYVPVVKLKDMLLACERAPVRTDVAVAPELEILTEGVPVTVKFVMLLVSQRVPPAPLQVMLPVPNARVLTFTYDELKNPVTKELLFRSNVPA